MGVALIGMLMALIDNMWYVLILFELWDNSNLSVSFLSDRFMK